MPADFCLCCWKWLWESNWHFWLRCRLLPPADSYLQPETQLMRIPGPGEVSWYFPPEWSRPLLCQLTQHCRSFWQPSLSSMVAQGGSFCYKKLSFIPLSSARPDLSTLRVLNANNKRASFWGQISLSLVATDYGQRPRIQWTFISRNGWLAYHSTLFLGKQILPLPVAVSKVVYEELNIFYTTIFMSVLIFSHITGQNILIKYQVF